MTINFDRSRTQKEYEGIINIKSFSELKTRKDELINHKLTKSELPKLKSDLELDALDYLYNAMLSLYEGIDSIYSRRFSWATVKLYYSVYYMLRASLACKGYAILYINSGYFRLSTKECESPYKPTIAGYNSTHKATILHHNSIFAKDDKLLSNCIDSKTTYEWMADVREILNYKSIVFREPEHLSVWDTFATAQKSNTLGVLLSRLSDDKKYIYCFQEDYAVVGIPIKRAYLTLKEFEKFGLLNGFQDDKKLYLKNLLKSNERKISIFSDIF